MSPPTPTASLPRMSRSLPLMIQGDIGLVEGEVCWVDLNRALVQSRQIFSVGAVFRARLDIDGWTMDMMLEIESVMQRQVGGMQAGYVMWATWAHLSEDDRPPFQTRMARVNPQIFAAPETSSPVSRPGRHAEAPTSTPGRRDPPSSPGRPAEAPVSTPGRRLSPPSRPGRPADNPVPTHTAPPRQTLSHGNLLVKSQLAAGPTLFIRFAASTWIARSLETWQDEPCLIVAAVDGLETDDEVTTLLQMPDYSFVQFRLRVVSKAGPAMRLSLRSLDQYQLRTLTEAAKGRILGR